MLSQVGNSLGMAGQGPRVWWDMVLKYAWGDFQVMVGEGSEIGKAMVEQDFKIQWTKAVDYRESGLG